MPKIEIYTTMLCPYCHAAKRLLTSKQQTFTEIDVTADRAGRQQMVSRADGRKTVPQIFINELHIGGCDELMALQRSGKLDALLTG